MSSIYIQEPPTSGKVLLTTSVGDIEIELWPREAPKASRNFVQLCMEGFYDGTIFHRIIKGFIAQGGDPTGTGSGGESIYTEPFKNEIHSRLRFNRRGLVATATGEDRNDSQFFFTFGAAPVLQNKHTIFGKVVGDTMFNMLKLEDNETDLEDRPLYPQKIIKAEVLINPFPDIKPRTLQTLSPNALVNSDKPKAPKEKIVPTKNFKLLSFGDEAEEDEEVNVNVNKLLVGKSKSTHDLLVDPTLSNETEAIEGDAIPAEQNQLEDSEKELAIKRVRNKLKLDKHEEDNSSNGLKKKMKPNQEVEVDEGENEKMPGVNTKKKSSVRTEYREEIKKYAAMKNQIPAKGPSRESQTFKMMMAFKERLKQINEKTENDSNQEPDTEDNSEMWMAKAFTCQLSKKTVLPKDANKLDDDWYDITDPRNTMNKRRREDSKRINNNRGRL